jgi:hypothetical protein
MTDTATTRATIARRRFLQGAAAVAAVGALRTGPGRAQEAVPNSSGTAPPRLKAPANACDCHMHAFDPERFPPPHPARLQQNARIADYRLLQKRIGTTRTVIVTPAAYVTDNRVTLDAIAQLAPSARGRGRPSDHHGRRAQDARRRRHSRHSLHPERSGGGHHHHRHDRAAVAARERARLARADSHARRPDRRRQGPVGPAAVAGRVRSHGPPAGGRHRRAGLRSCAASSTRAAPG